MKRWAAIGAVVACLLFVLTAYGQTEVIISDGFDSAGTDEWTPLFVENEGGTLVTNTAMLWMSTKCFGSWPFNHCESGVLEISRLVSTGAEPSINKTVYLQPGQYELIVRASAGVAANSYKTLSAVLVGDALRSPGAVYTLLQPGTYPGLAYYTLSAAPIIVDTPGDVTIRITATDQMWLDSITLQSVTGYATPTTAPSVTPIGTPIPPAYQATALPTPTAYCVPRVPTATPGPYQFGATPTVTPTVAADAWGVLDRFWGRALSSSWAISGSEMHVDGTIPGYNGSLGVLVAKYSGDEPGGRPAHTLVMDRPITPTVYLDGYAKADVIQAGDYVSITAWLYDANGDWIYAGAQAISAGYWYPFHIAVSPEGGVPPYSAMGVNVMQVPWGNYGYGAYIDNLYAYSDLSMAPYCDGTYPGTATVVDGTTPPGSPVVTGNGDSTLLYPDNKTCPPGTIDVPNNFWGPIFAWQQIQFYRITAFWPEATHFLASVRDSLDALLDAPIWVWLSVGTMMFDLRPLLYALLAVLGMEMIRGIYSIWRLIRSIIPFL